MITSDDTRIWLDRVQGREQFGAFPDQRFYSVEYPFEDTKPALRTLMALADRYSEWCREAFLSVRQGLAMPELPEDLQQAAAALDKSSDLARYIADLEQSVDTLTAKLAEERKPRKRTTKATKKETSDGEETE